MTTAAPALEEGPQEAQFLGCNRIVMHLPVPTPDGTTVVPAPLKPQAYDPLGRLLKVDAWLMACRSATWVNQTIEPDLLMVAYLVEPLPELRLPQVQEYFFVTLVHNRNGAFRAAVDELGPSAVAGTTVVDLNDLAVLPKVQGHAKNSLPNSVNDIVVKTQCAAPSRTVAGYTIGLYTGSSAFSLHSMTLASHSGYDGCAGGVVYMPVSPVSQFIPTGHPGTASQQWGIDVKWRFNVTTTAPS